MNKISFKHFLILEGVITEGITQEYKFLKYLYDITDKKIKSFDDIKKLVYNVFEEKRKILIKCMLVKLARLIPFDDIEKKLDKHFSDFTEFLVSYGAKLDSSSDDDAIRRTKQMQAAMS